MSARRGVVRGVDAPGRRPTPAHALLLLRRMGIPILLGCAALDLLASLLLG